MAEFIYTMKKVRKAHGDKVILDDVTMSFYPGAKIGVVGPNGAGKSSILKIMAGLDQPSNGEAFLDPDATVGILLQEPPLNEEKTVKQNVEEGLGDIKVKLDRFNEIGELMAEPDADFDTLLADADPRFVKIEMDLFWIIKGGGDPLEYFAKWPNRFPMVHVKDMAGGGMMTNVGQGHIDWGRIFAKRREAGIEHFFVEHDSAAQYPGGWVADRLLGARAAGPGSRIARTSFCSSPASGRAPKRARSPGALPGIRPRHRR